MGYTLSALISPFDFVEGGPRATHIGRYSFGQFEDKPSNDGKVIMVLLLFAAYANLLLNLMRVPDHRVLEASR